MSYTVDKALEEFHEANRISTLKWCQAHNHECNTCGNSWCEYRVADKTENTPEEND